MPMKLGPYEPGPNDTPENGIYLGDCRTLAKAIPDESIDLIFTDPIYNRIDDYRWLAEMAARILRANSWCLVYYGIGYLPQTVAAMSAFLTYEWQHINYMPTLNARGAYKTFSNYRALLRYMKGQALPCRDARDLLQDKYDVKNNGHSWAKNLDVIANWMRAYSRDGATIVDFFTGGGAIPAACKMLGRRYLAFEIDPATGDMARERVRQTQPPLFVPSPAQVEMEFSEE